MKTYEPLGGDSITHTAEEMVKLANFTGQPVTAMFNDIPLDTAPGGDPDGIVRSYTEEMERQRQEYEASPEYAKRQQEMKERDEQKARDLTAALASAPATPTMRDEEGWQKSVEANKDGGYSEAVMIFADQWARIMEAKVAAGAKIEECADEACGVANNVGLTGFQYGCAVSILSQCWTHGEALRVWHNLKTQIGTEGEKANESGGVLNPALLSVG